MTGFDLRANPFHVLGVSARSDAAAIARAADEAISSGRVGEAEARAAERALIDPEARLIAEVGWFPGVPARRIAALRSLLDSGGEDDDGNPLPAMARANVLADRCARDYAAGYGGTLRRLLEAHAEIDVADLARAIDIDRSAAGLPAVDAAGLGRALARVRDAHAEAALEAVYEDSQPADVADALARRYLADGAMSEGFLDGIVEKYLARAEPRLAGAEAAVRDAVAAFDRGGQQTDFDRVVEALEAWRAEIAARLILRNAKRTAEPRTAALCAEVLAAAKSMATVQKSPDKADALHRALETVFSDIGSVTDQVARNRGEIMGALAGHDPYEIASALIAALKEADRDLREAAVALRVSGFRRDATGWAGRLYAGFADAAVRLAGTDAAEVPWNALLQLVDRLRGAAASRALLDGLEAFAEAPLPPAVAAKIEAARRAEEAHARRVDMAAAAGRGRPGRVRRLMQRAETRAADDEAREATDAVGAVMLDAAAAVRSHKRREFRNDLLYRLAGGAVIVGAVVLWQWLFE
jgi:hypothetical protein